MGQPVLSVVIPVFNEEDCLEECHARLRHTLTAAKISYELIFVNDGSADGSRELLKRLRAADSHVKTIDFSQKTCLPASKASCVMGKCVNSGVAMMTDSTFLSASISR